MSVTSISDLAQSLTLRQDNARLRADLLRQTSELSSGRKSDLTTSLRGDFNALAGFESGLARADAFLAVIADSRLETDAMQTSIGLVRTVTQDLAATMLVVPDSGDPLLVDTVAQNATDRFSAALSALNTQVGGRSLFSGIATDLPALGDEDTILSALEAEVALIGAVTADDVANVVNAWFGPAGGFETIAYTGNATAREGVRVSNTETLPSTVKADDLRLRETLAALAMGALLDRGTLDGRSDERAALTQAAGRQLLEADRDLVSLQSDLGVTQNQIERAATEAKGERDALALARSDLIGIDPFDVAARLQETENQLQALYALTAKLSQLTLTDYI